MTTRVANGVTTTFRYDIAGSVTSTDDGTTAVDVTSDASKNYAVPSVITPNSNSSLQEVLDYTDYLALESDTGPNGAFTSMAYDNYARPQSSTSVHGATTTFEYVNSWPATVTAVTNGRWTRTTMDGLGRTTKTETGHGWPTAPVTTSTVETGYDACACLPLGKVKQVSMPYAPGATVYWTTQNYDGLGRLTSVVQPNGSGTTGYAYAANTVTVTDPAGKWKKYTHNALGELVQVNEPNPAGGADYVTTYKYNVRGQLTDVIMPRGSDTQTRTFSYDPVTGRLNWATNPENGTVNYSYNADGTVDYKTDQKGQKIDYIYDAYKRVTEIRRYSGTFPYNEVTCERTTLYYDTNPLLTGFTQNGYGRLVAAQWGGPTCTGGQWTEMYSYKVSGRVLKKRLSRGDGQSGVYLEGSWTWDDEGRMQSVTYPLGGPTYTYEFDAMGRPWKLKDNATPPVEWAKEAHYDAGNRLTTLEYISSGTSYYHEERGYNTLGQLTSIEVPGVVHQTYTFSATQNNGRIVRMNDLAAQPPQEVNYVYDELNRLKEAKTTDSAQWGQSFTYDGFGNRTAETVIQGTAPSLTLAYDPATNRIVSDGYAYDLNGNLTKLPAHSMTTPDALQYDIENRLIKAIHNSNGTDEYRYDPANKRVWKKKPNGQEDTYFYGVNGEKLGTYSGSGGFSMLHTNLYFAGKLIRAEGQVAVLDRLGSVANGKKYFPYGEEQGQTTPQEQTKFATYFRDTTTALDYADQRYYSRSIGRFLTVDASGPADLHRPQSLNRYSYVVNDPVNLADPDGRWYLCVGSFLGGTTINDASSPCAVGFPFFIGLPNPTYEDLPPPFLQRLALLSDVILGWDFLSNDGTTLTVYLSESVYDHLLGLGFMAGAEATAQTMCEGLPPQYKIGCKVGAGVVILIGVGIGIITEMVDLLIKQQTRTPVVGDPNSTQEFPSKNGRTVRVYGPDGRAVKDIDYCDQAHSGNDPEVHDWDWSSGKPVRGPARPPTEGEVPKEGGG